MFRKFTQTFTLSLAILCLVATLVWAQAGAGGGARFPTFSGTIRR